MLYRARGQCKPRYGADTGQGFSSKPERCDRFQIIKAGYFTGGMAAQCQRKVAFSNATSVITDPDQFYTTLLNLNLNAVCTSVECVFNQFFDNRCRALNHLADSNLVCQPRRE